MIFVGAGLFLALKHKWHWIVSIGCLLGLAYLVFATAEGRADVGAIETFFRSLGSGS